MARQILITILPAQYWETGKGGEKRAEKILGKLLFILLRKSEPRIIICENRLHGLNILLDKLSFVVLQFFVSFNKNYTYRF